MHDEGRARRAAFEASMTSQYLYVSRAAAGLAPLDHKLIVGASQMLNRRNDVTGVLVHAGAYFLQLVEGERQTVKSLLSRIFKDRRHADVRLLLALHQQPVRLFGSWSMELFESMALEDAIARTYSAGQHEVHEHAIRLRRAVLDLAQAAGTSSTTLSPDLFRVRLTP